MSEILPTTQLDAVNTILSNAGEAPLNSLDSQSGVDSVMALNVLNEVTRKVLTRGWKFNSEKSVTFSPDGTTKYITLPSNVAAVDEPEGSYDNFCMRGNRLYDIDNHSYEWDGDVDVDVVYLLPFTEIPQVARDYITIQAARTYATRVLSGTSQARLNQEDETRALVALNTAEGMEGDYNIFNQPGLSIMVSRGSPIDQYGGL